MTQDEFEQLPADIFDTPPKNEREVLLRVSESMGDIASRAYSAAQDMTVTESELRQLLEDIGLDISTLFVAASTIVEDEAHGIQDVPSQN